MAARDRYEVRGVYVASTTPFTEDGSVDFETFAQHCSWMADAGVAGITPNGSLGEYETLTDAERSEMVKVASEGVSGRIPVIPGVSGKSAREARRWAEEAAALGCPAVMALPPTSHAPTDEEVLAHYREIAAVGLPIIAYNNPFSTRVDLKPHLLGRLAEIEQVVAVKEFSQDIRRVAAIQEQAPGLQILCGCDDTFVETMLMGAVGWMAGFVNALPVESVRLYELCKKEKWPEALALYRAMLPLLRYDADPIFVQAIKIAQDEVGRSFGGVRLPRLSLPKEQESTIRTVVRDLLATTG
jgi:dihydrodipicolinate synthase/N-acetylneuraminate lyase